MTKDVRCKFCIAERALVPESQNNIDTSIQRVSGGARLLWWLSYRFAPLYDLPCGAAAPWVSHNDSIDAIHFRMENDIHDSIES